MLLVLGLADGPDEIIGDLAGVLPSHLGDDQFGLVVVSVTHEVEGFRVLDLAEAATTVRDAQMIAARLVALEALLGVDAKVHHGPEGLEVLVDLDGLRLIDRGRVGDHLIRQVDVGLILGDELQPAFHLAPAIAYHPNEPTDDDPHHDGEEETTMVPTLFHRYLLHEISPPIGLFLLYQIVKNNWANQTYQ